jgi:hypothetical protein
MFNLENNELMEQFRALRTLKTINTPFVTDEFMKIHNCHNCKNWIDNECLIQGEIKNIKSCYCSWYKDKNLKVRKSIYISRIR